MIRLAAVLVMVTCVAATRANDDARPSRSRKKSDNSPPITVIVVQHEDAQSQLVGVPVIVAPPTAVAAPSSGTPYVNCSEGPLGTKCATSSLAKICPKLDRPKPAQDCLGCSTFRCEYRFAWGSCRAFFGEGRYAPKYPENCPCDK